MTATEIIEADGRFTFFARPFFHRINHLVVSFRDGATPEASFEVRSDAAEADVRRWIALAVQAREASPGRNRDLCCGLGRVVPCVCAVATSCPLHGGRHVGTHD